MVSCGRGAVSIQNLFLFIATNVRTMSIVGGLITQTGAISRGRKRDIPFHSQSGPRDLSMLTGSGEGRRSNGIGAHGFA